jgi:hypothetical protein
MYYISWKRTSIGMGILKLLISGYGIPDLTSKRKTL